ncbi:MAG: SGNH/GDSL hydrolase family protein [Rhodothermales bacterium]|nr:SGNH/GDSL hydrolase family protein [Rhodothermales bacterium]
MSRTVQSNGRTKTTVFALIAISLPIILIVILEAVFRIAGIGSAAYREFVPLPGREDHLAMNPDYVARYFPSFVPAVPFTPFLKDKDDFTFRVFVVGGSSTAGFPYQFYHGFPRRLAARLEAVSLDRRVEVVNLGMSAVNSYTIWDLRNAIADADPDVVVVYAGHNEYYGSFGAASTVNNVLNSVRLKRTVLRLKRSVIYSALERLLSRSHEADTDRTLMAQVVKQAGIEKDSDLFNRGIEQFRRNMSDVLMTWADRGIDIYVGTLVANLSDQAPLGDNIEARMAYDSATSLLGRGEFVRARQGFVVARDLDDIRFRAPSEINDVIRGFDRIDGVTVVDLETTFAQSAGNAEGDSLFIDHLHPNHTGYDLIGEIFFRELYAGNAPTFLDVSEYRIDRLDSLAAAMQIARIKTSYPFVKGASAEEEMAAFQQYLSAVRSELLAPTAESIVRGDAVMPVSLQETIQSNPPDLSNMDKLLLYRSLANWQPLNVPLLTSAINIALSDSTFDRISGEIAAMSMHRNSDVNSTNALAAIRLRQKQYDYAGFLLDRVEAAEPDNVVMLFNRARLLVVQGDTAQARLYFDRYQSASSANQ